MNQDLLERILECPSLPTLPAVAVQVLELTRRPSISLEELASTIQKDQALTAKILQTVNSSFFGLRRPCANINQAIVMLGMSAVKCLALGFSLVAALGDRIGSEFDFVPYWRRGLYTAVAAKCIAHEAGLATEDEAFLGGLLQDVGMVAMFHGLGRKYLEVMLQADTDHRSLIGYELAELELQHPDVGAMLCERWKLPQELLVPVRFHERPTAAPEEFADLVRAVGMGNVAHDVLTDAEPDAALKRFKSRGAQWFDFDDEVSVELIRRIAEGTRQLTPLFSIDTGEAGDIDAILAKARTALKIIQEQPPDERSHGASLESLVSDSDQHDALTGVWSARAILRHADAAFFAAGEKNRNLTIVVVGLDGFKEVVQRGGQEAADAVLVEASLCLLEHVQPLGGEVSRWGNATFCLVLMGVDRAEATRVAVEVKAELSSQSLKWDVPIQGWGGITASVGCATVEFQERAFTKVEQVISAAARAMEAATAVGGNRSRTFIPKKVA